MSTILTHEPPLQITAPILPYSGALIGFDMRFGQLLNHHRPQITTFESHGSESSGAGDAAPDTLFSAWRMGSVR